MDNTKSMRLLMFESSNKADIKQLEIIYNEGHKLTVHCGYVAAGNQDIETLIWLYNHGCEINTFTVIANVQNFGNYVSNKDAKLPADEAYFMMLFSQRLCECQNNYDTQILDWLQSIKFKFNVNLIVKYAALANNITALNWFVSHKYDIKYKEILMTDKQNMSFDIKDWFQIKIIENDTYNAVICI